MGRVGGGEFGRGGVLGSMDSAFGGNSEGSFEPDDFYESFLAPKFHDFTAPEEPIDPDAYFMAQPGMVPILVLLCLLSRDLVWAFLEVSVLDWIKNWTRCIYGNVLDQ